MAIVAARKGLAELSLAVAVGSASQVGMVVAPAAVLFGFLTGNPFTLYLPVLPLAILAISVFATYHVLRDGQWDKDDGVVLLALYGANCIMFVFTA